MGYFDGYNANTGRPVNAGPDWGKTQWEINPIPVIVGWVLASVVIVIVFVVAIKVIKKYNLTDTAIRNKKFYLTLSKKPWWRFINVVYWITAFVVAGFAFNIDDNSYGAYGVLVTALSYPGYLGLRRLTAYIFNAGESSK